MVWEANDLILLVDDRLVRLQGVGILGNGFGLVMRKGCWLQAYGETD